MTDANGRGETWHFYRDQEKFLNLVAEFPTAVYETDDNGMRITGWIMASGQDESSVLANIIHRANACVGSELDVPLLRGLGEPVSTEEVRLRLAAFGY